MFHRHPLLQGDVPPPAAAGHQALTRAWIADELRGTAVGLPPRPAVSLHPEWLVESWETGSPDAFLSALHHLPADELREAAVGLPPEPAAERQRPPLALLPQPRLLLSQAKP